MTTPILLLQWRSMLAWSILRRPTTTTTTTSDSIIVLFIGTCVIPIIYIYIYILRASFYRGFFRGRKGPTNSSHPKKWISHRIFCQPWFQVVSCYQIFTRRGGDTRCCVVIVVPQSTPPPPLPPPFQCSTTNQLFCLSKPSVCYGVSILHSSTILFTKDM